MTVTARKLRNILEDLQDGLSPYSDDTPIHVRIGYNHVSISSEDGFIYDIHAEVEDEDEEAEE